MHKTKDKKCIKFRESNSTTENWTLLWTNGKLSENPTWLEKISRVEIIAVEIIPFSVVSKLFILFLINFVVITTFFYNLQLTTTVYPKPVPDKLRNTESEYIGSMGGAVYRWPGLGSGYPFTRIPEIPEIPVGYRVQKIVPVPDRVRVRVQI